MNQSLLIVDDNPDDVEITKMVLARIDREIKATSVPRGEVALEILRGENPLPTMILLDLKMPGMNGFDALRKIRADERLKHIPVIIVTSSALEADEKMSYEIGAAGFTHKAFDIDQFERELKSILERCLIRKREDNGSDGLGRP